MATQRTSKKAPTKTMNKAFELRASGKAITDKDSKAHLIKPGIICDTESKGHSSPEGRSPLEIVVDATEGFIPLWAANTKLRWRFRERSMKNFADPEAAKNEIRKLLGEVLLAWGTAAPIKFTEDRDLWDFEIVMRRSDECDDGGCVLASAFFPDQGRHELVLYPMMFTQTKQEQLDTLVHEVGHIFGLRHFFAQVSEKKWRSEVFGTHSKFSIMNYGNLSKLTAADKKDLKQLYASAWAGELTDINGTPIRFVKPYSMLAFSADNFIAPVSIKQFDVTYLDKS